MQDRVKELRRVPASELRANPKNWRRHPPSQQAALRGVLEDIGFADAVIARETPDGLELIDGHLRQEVMGDQVVPVLIVDVTEEEADKMLLTYDPLAMMAHADQDQLLNLLHDTQFADKAINDMLEAVANGERLPMPDLTDEWEGMPEFTEEDATSWNHIIVHFANEEDMAAFAQLVQQNISNKRVSIWYPAQPYMPAVNRYVTE